MKGCLDSTSVGLIGKFKTLLLKLVHYNTVLGGFDVTAGINANKFSAFFKNFTSSLL
jgi:hypothetical protein